MRRAFIYVRVSTLKQGRGYSIPEQIKSCTEYAERMGYMVIGDPFVEQYTGTEMVRPVWDALIAALAENRIEIIILDVVDRLARELAIQLIFEKEVSRLGARIEYASESNDDSDEGRL